MHPTLTLRMIHRLKEDKARFALDTSHGIRLTLLLMRLRLRWWRMSGRAG